MPRADKAEGGSPARGGSQEKLLDAAELLFADHGYAGCSLRMIASKSKINLGLLHYFFGTKENLFSQVFLRRANLVAARRLALLDDAEQTSGTAPVPIEVLLRSFIEPPLRMFAEGPHGRAFLRIHSNLRTEPVGLGLRLRRQAFGTSTARYVAAMVKACPHLPKEAVYWRFDFMIGSYLVIASQSGRLAEFSQGKADPTDMDQAILHIVPFLKAAFLAPAP